MWTTPGAPAVVFAVSVAQPRPLNQRGSSAFSIAIFVSVVWPLAAATTLNGSLAPDASAGR